MEKRKAARWRFTQGYARQYTKGILASAAVLFIGLTLVISALILIVFANSQSRWQSSPAAVYVDAAWNLGFWGAVVCFIGFLLSLDALSLPTVPDGSALDTATSINIEHAGNVFFIVMFLAVCLVSVLAMILAGVVAMPFGLMTLVFLLIIRRAYVRYKRRKAVRRQDTG